MAVNERDDRDPRLERLYREAAQDEPPAHLDAAILAAARREVGARPRSHSSALRRWHVPVSIAAVVVASVSLVVLVREEGGEQIRGARAPTVAKPAERPTPPLKDPPAAAASQSAQPRVEAPAPAELRELREDSGRPAVQSKLEDPARRERDSTAASEAGAAARGPAAKPSPEPFRATPSQPAQERAAAPASPDMVAAGRLGAVAPEPLEKQAAASAADALSARTMARAMAAKPAGDDRPPIWLGFEKEPPEKWLVRIEELVREGRASEAEAMRAEFKRRFPDHPLARGAK